MSKSDFKKTDQSESILKRIRIEKSRDMDEKDVEDFASWICGKAERLGFNVKYIDEDKAVD